MNRFSMPVWLLGGRCGSDTFLRLRILDRAERRTNAPKRDRTLRSALLVASMTFFESKKRPFIWSTRSPIMVSPHRPKGERQHAGKLPQLLQVLLGIERLVLRL